MIGALKATPTICLQQHDCIASLVGKASSENKSAGRVGVVPRIVLVIGFGVCVRITDGVNEFPSVLYCTFGPYKSQMHVSECGSAL